jgi:branched-chain amino acid transport system substrate-binding protein
VKFKIYQGGGANSEEFIKQSGSASEGVYVVGPAFIISKYLSDNDPQKALALAYDKAFRDRWNATPNTFGGSAYDAFMMVKLAMIAAGQRTRRRSGRRLKPRRISWASRASSI